MNCVRHPPIRHLAICLHLAACGIAFAALPPVPVPPENPITEPKRALGKILFWDEQLSTSNTVSCATCHNPAAGGSDNRARVRNPGSDGLFNTPDDMFGSAGIIHSSATNDVVLDATFGVAPQVTGRAANPPINAAFAIDLFWDGRARSQFVDPQTGQVAIPVGGALESQVVGPPVNNVEMAHDGTDWTVVAAKLQASRPLDYATALPSDVATALADHPSYPELFRRAFGDPAITARRIAFAIATYERTLIANQTPFDQFRAGQQNAMTPQQVQGFNLFQTRQCAACHSLVNDLTTDQSFRNIGLRPPAEDLGRQIVTGNTADRGKFKVPSLRNVGLKTSFMHNGQFTSLQQVIDFYARAPGAAPQFPDNRDPIIPTINLGPQDRPLVDDFVRNALTDPRVAGQTFPFDHPTLFTNRSNDATASLGGGVAGSGGVTPRVLVLSPSMIGNLDYRIGIDSALGGATASLGISLTAPVNGRITPTQFAGSVTLQGSGAGNGLATLHWPLSAGLFSAGQILFAQWFVTDGAAPGGQALSNVVRIPVFCGSTGCCQALTAQATASAACASGTATFSAVATGHVGTPTFQWERETAPNSGVFVALSNGPTAAWDGGASGIGGIVSGANTPNLTVAADTSHGRILSSAHAIQYRVSVSSICGAVSSNAVPLMLTPAGTGDTNGDGIADAADIQTFVATVFAGGAVQAGLCAADMNHDGQIGAADVALFVTALTGQ